MKRRYGLIFVLLVLVAACQSALPVEESRPLPISFATPAFVPPPRTVQDITTVLDQERLSNSARREQLLAKADATPPSRSAGPQQLANFYQQRGQAARDLGRAKQALADMMEALTWAPYDTRAGAIPTNTTWYRVVTELATLENVGDYQTIIKYMQRASSELPTGRGMQVSLNSRLASAYAAVGDFTAASEAAAKAHAALEASQQWGVRSWETAAEHKQVVVFWNVQVLDADAVVSEARGEYETAERLYREEIRQLTSDPTGTGGKIGQGVSAGISRARKRLALVLLRQGRLLEAESEARLGLLDACEQPGRNTFQAGDAALTLARVLMEQGRFVDAERLNRAALDIFDRSGVTADAVLVVTARQALGASLVAQGHWSQALSEFERIGSTDSADFGIALVQVGRLEEAIDVFRAGLARSQQTTGKQSASTAELHGLLGMAYARVGQSESGLREFRTAVPLLLGVPLESRDDEPSARPMRDERLGLILASYISILADIRGTSLEHGIGLDASDEAFRLADVARGRQVQRAVDANVARASAMDPSLGTLVRDEQDLKKQAEARFGLLANLLAEPPERQDVRVISELRRQAEALGERRRELRQRIAREFPTYARLVNPMPATLTEARASLHPGEALIATYATEARLFVWAVPFDGVPVFATRTVSESTMAEVVNTIRRALDPAAQTLGDIPPFDVGTAHELYRQVLEPVKAGWVNADRLLIVTHGSLGQLPFALLPTAAAAAPDPETAPLFANYRAIPWLVRTHAVTVLPSVTSLVTLRTLPPGDPTRWPFIGFGDPYFSMDQARRGAAQQNRDDTTAFISTEAMSIPALMAVPARSRSIALRDLRISTADSVNLALLPRLPDTADEIRGMALALQADLTRDVFLQERATEQAVKTTDLSRYRVIAFATHGLAAGDLDGLAQPALALTAPGIGNTEGDGLLTMEEILTLRLNADWVVLSACNTASSQGAGSEAISGLGRAFFYAGARALLVSNWPVETTSARALTTEVFRRQAADPGLSRARALQQAMIALIDGGELRDSQNRRVVASYAHPIFWAPFALVGDGG